MCKCTPNVRTPFCGKPGCEWSKPEGTRKVIPIADTRELRQYKTFAAWYAENSKNIDPSDFMAWLQVAFEAGQDSALIESGFGELDSYLRGEHGPNHG